MTILKRRVLFGKCISAAWQQFFVLYISLLVIFLLLFAGFVNLTGSILTNQAAQTAKEMLQKGMLRLDITLSSYKTAGLSLSDHILLGGIPADQLQSMDFKYYRAIESQKIFANATINLPDKTTAGMIFKNGAALVGTRFFTNTGMLYEKFLTVEGLVSFKSWEDFLHEGRGGRLLPTHNYYYDGRDYRALTYALPLPLNSARANSVFFITVQERDLLNMLLPSDCPAYRQIALYDQNGRLLFSQGEAVTASDDIWLTIKGTGGLRAEIALDHQAFTAQLAPFRYFVILFMGIYLLVGILAAWWTAHRSSGPIIRLMQMAAGEPPPVKDSTKGMTCEYRYIHDVLQQHGMALEVYKDELAVQTGQMRHYIMVSLLEGMVDASESEKLAKEHFRDFWPTGQEPFFMLLIHMERREEADGLSTATFVQSLLRDCLPANSLLYNLHTHEAIALVKGEADRAAVAAGTEAALSKLPGGGFRIAASGICEGLRDIRDTYMLLQHRLRLSNRGETVIFRDEDGEKDGQACAGQPLRHEEKHRGSLPPISSNSVYRLMMNGQGDALAALLGECELYITRVRPEAENTLCYVYYACTGAVDELAAKLPGLRSLRMPAYSIRSDIAILFAELREMLLEGCRYVNEYYSQFQSAPAQQVMKFIDDNIGNHELYAKMVTHQFSISENALQQIAREVSGQSFFGYVEQARMQKALALVRETAMPISQIYQECGYITRTTFFRAFQRNFGMSPRKMREGGEDGERKGGEGV